MTYTLQDIEYPRKPIKRYYVGVDTGNLYFQINPTTFVCLEEGPKNKEFAVVGKTYSGHDVEKGKGLQQLGNTIIRIET